MTIATMVNARLEAGSKTEKQIKLKVPRLKSKIITLENKIVNLQ